MQKASAAKRVYATVVNARTNTDGNKEQGITFPSGDMQKKLIKEVYSEAGINPADVAYVEAHGTGTKVNLTSIILVTVLQLIVGMTGTITDHKSSTWLKPKYVLERAFHILLSDWSERNAVIIEVLSPL